MSLVSLSANSSSFSLSDSRNRQKSTQEGQRVEKEKEAKTADQQERGYSSLVLGSKLEEIMLHEMTSSRKGRWCMKSATCLRSRFAVHFLPRLLHLERSGPGPCKKRGADNPDFTWNFCKLIQSWRIARCPACSPAKPFFTRPPSIGAKGERREGETKGRRRERERRSHFPPFLPRTALRAAKRRWRSGQGTRAATNERSPADKKGFASCRAKVEMRRGKGGREEKKEPRNRQQQRRRRQRWRNEKRRGGEGRWLVRSVVVGLFPPPTDRQSSECVLRSVCLPARLQLLLSCHYSPSSRTRRPSSIVGRGGTGQREAAGMPSEKLALTFWEMLLSGIKQYKKVQKVIGSSKKVTMSWLSW